MLHHTQVTSLAKEHAELFQKEGADAVRAALPKTFGPKKIEVEAVDVEDIIDRLESGEVKPEKKAKTEEKTSPKTGKANEGLDLSGFDYTRLKGEDWKRYHEIEEKLMARELYTYGVYEAIPIRTERYPGLPNSPRDITGIRLKRDAPLKTVRIEAKRARNLNAQLPNGNNDIPCQYYLLAK